MFSSDKEKDYFHPKLWAFLELVACIVLYIFFFCLAVFIICLCIFGIFQMFKALP